ncbi:MAG: hypothetical protein AAGA23_00725 [Pseudomonadota bacterium]
MAGTALLTLGRLPKALDLARALAGAGWRVLVAEPGKRHLSGYSRSVHASFQVAAPVHEPERYLDDLVSLIQREGVDLVVPVSEECLHTCQLYGRVPDHVRIASLPPAELIPLHSKWDFVQSCQRFGLAVPETARLGSGEAETLVQRLPVIVKREYSCAGVGLERVAKGEALPEREEPAEWLVQEQIDGTELCTFSVAHEGRVLGTVLYRGTVVSGTVAVCFERLVADARVTEFVERFVAGSGASGFVAFDLIQNSEGVVHGIECNPRATSGVHFIEAEDLALALTDPASCHELRLRPHRLMQQFYPCLTETQLAFGKWPRFRRYLGQLIRAKEVCFQWRDPLPFWLLPYAAWPILSMTLFQGKSFGEAATWDIEWEPPAS